MTDIEPRARDIRRRIALAAERAGRDPAGVRLVAVTKTVGAERIREAADAGLGDFGENRVQEAREKAGALGDLNIAWHMVGHLQRNKARLAAGLFELIHSVDSAELLQLLDRYAREAGVVQRVLVQVNLSAEPRKSGVSEDGLGSLIEGARGLGSVRIEGLMTMPPFAEDPELSRPYYARLSTLAGQYGLGELSMGMTGDFEVAVEEGATLVRIGSAIFGQR